MNGFLNGGKGRMKMIAAADRRGGIGKNGRLLAHLPGDMKYFRETTAGAMVIMGRKTLESFPGGRPLKGRRNLVISRTLSDDEMEGVEVCRSPEEAEMLASEETDREVFVIGGGKIYASMLPYCREAYITEIDAVLDADTYIPVFSELPDWECVSRSPQQEENGLKYAFTVYRRKGNGA